MFESGVIDMDIQLKLEQAYQLCVAKIKQNMPRLSMEPKACAFAEDGNYFEIEEGFFDITNWTTSFFTGMALIAYETTRDADLLSYVYRMAGFYEKKVFDYGMDTMHDLGFLYTLYSVALFKLNGDLNSRKTALKAADELAKRFVLSGNYIRAWGRMDDRDTNYAGLAIVETMMNLPLLFWASETTGNPFYHELAVRHANTTAKHFVREDGSVYHAFHFDEEAGEPLDADNYGGNGVESSWARGTAWAIYGFALAYSYTKKIDYLNLSKKIAVYFVKQLDQSYIPLWDFQLPPGERQDRDSSAAAIAACGMLEIVKHDPSQSAFRDVADNMIWSLADRYTDFDLERPGVLKSGQSVKGLNGYSSWGDYFFMEALARKLYYRTPYW